MKQDKVLQVCYEDQTVGTLAMTADYCWIACYGHINKIRMN